MTGGSRAKTGCFTCRLRKKKCDEQRPACQACSRSLLACYGYDAPVPAWITNKSSWAEVRNSIEAKNIRSLAENHYKVSRKVQSEGDSEQVAEAILDVGQNFDQHGSGSNTTLTPLGPTSILLARLGVTKMANIWQLQPDTIWWDSKIGSLGATDGSASQQETRLLMIFLQIVHPITHTFYRISSNSDRNWLLNRIVRDRALYYAALSVSACFEFSLTQPTTVNEIGICPRVRSLQSLSVQKLRTAVETYTASTSTYSQELVLEGIRLVDVILNLLNLETWSMLDGCWSMHHRAARAIFNHLGTSIQSGITDRRTNPIKSALQALDIDYDRRRTLEFCIDNFVWIDVVATATFGLRSFSSCNFDYIPLLNSGDIRPQDVMGCSILGTVAEIARLEQWCDRFEVLSAHVDPMTELTSSYKHLTNKLRTEIVTLETRYGSFEPSHDGDTTTDADLISVAWAYAALVYLEFVVLRTGMSSPDVIHALVDSCLQKLEQLPTYLIMRVCWPFTISGSLSTDELQHERFREILAKTFRERQAPGLVWKGLIVMEECWRLQTTQEDMRSTIGWREAMSSLNTKVLLV